MLKLLFMLSSFVPLLLRSYYLIQAWKSSRLDHWDWIFYLAAIPAAIWAVRSERREKFDFYALAVLIPLLVLALFTQLHHINALSVAAAVGVIWAAAWFCCSWSFACKLFPAAVVLLLGTPSSSYQLSLLFMCSVSVAWMIKFVAMLLCFILIWCNNHFCLQVKKGTFLFLAACAGTALLLLHTKELYFEGKSFIPDFPAHAGEYWGRTLVPDANTGRFFATSSVKQYRYTRGNGDISVLAVRCGKNIHEIHPASHCLRTSLWQVHTEKTLFLQDNFAVTEIDAQKGAHRILVWVWYSSERFSTPGFLGFRRHFNPKESYYTYQISIPTHGSIETGRNELRNFVRVLKPRSMK